jgi:hypothetical protein
VATYTYNGRKTLKACRCFGQERSDVGPSPEAPWGGAESNQIATTVVENGLFTATRSYDAAGRLTGITHSRSVGVPPTSSTTLSRSVGVPPTSGTSTYTANSVNEYTTWSGGILPPSYDPNGNQIKLRETQIVEGFK